MERKTSVRSHLDITFEKFYDEIKKGTLDSSSELLSIVNLSNTYDFHKDDPALSSYQHDLLSVIHYAVLFNRVNIVELFLNLSISCNVRTIFEEMGEKKRLLLVSKKRYYNDTPLHIAAREGFSNIVRFLLTQKEINVEIMNFRDEKAVDVAKNEEIKTMLEEFLESKKNQKKKNSCEVQIIEIQKKWEIMRSFFEKPIDFSRLNDPKKIDSEHLNHILKTMTNYRNSLDHQFEKLDQFTRSQQQQQQDDEKKIQIESSSSDRKKKISSFIVSVCKEINFFKEKKGEWVGSYNLPEKFFSDEGVKNFNNSIWKEKNLNQIIKEEEQQQQQQEQKKKKKKKKKKEPKKEEKKEKKTLTLFLDYERNKQKKMYTKTIIEKIKKKRDDDDDKIIQQQKEKIEKKQSFGGDNSFQQQQQQEILPCKSCQISGSQIAIGNSNGVVFIKDFFNDSESNNFMLEGHSNQITVLSSSFVPSSRNNFNLLLSGSYSSQICLWDLNKRSLIHQFNELHTSEINDLHFLSSLSSLSSSSNFDNFVSASSDGFVKFINLTKNKVVGEYYDHHQLPVSCLSPNPEENIIFSGGFDKFVRIYDFRINSGKSKKFIKLEDSITSLCYVSNKNMVLCGYGFGDICAVDYRMISSSDEEKKRRGVLWNNKNLHTSQINKIIRLYNPSYLSNNNNNKKEEEEEELEGEEDNNNNKEDQFFATSGNDGFIKICEYNSGISNFKILERQPCYGIFRFDCFSSSTNNNNNNQQQKPYFKINKKTHFENMKLLDSFREKNDLKQTTSNFMRLFTPKNKKILPSKTSTKEYENEFIESLGKKEEEEETINSSRKVLDGRIFKIIDIVNRIRDEKSKLINLRNYIKEQRLEVGKWLKSELFRKFGVVMIPFYKSIREEKKKLIEIRNEVSLWFKENRNFARLQFLKKSYHYLRKSIKKEKEELEDMRIYFKKNLKKFFKVLKGGILSFSRNIQSLFQQRRSLTTKFKMREDLRLCYGKGEWIKLTNRVGQIKKMLIPIHKNIIKTYHDLISIPLCKLVVKNKELFKKWRHKRYTEKTIDIVENFHDEKRQIYIGEMLFEKAHGKGCIYIKTKKTSLRKVINIRGGKGKSYMMIYDGNFLNNLIHGKGLQYTDEKIVYEGLFKNGVRHGKGVSYDLAGKSCMQGIWTSGKLTNKRNDDGDGTFHFEIIRFDEIEDQLIAQNELGKGANGVVYAIVYEGKECAAKIMDLKLIDPMTKSRIRHYIRRSLRLCASFDHPNVIRIFGMIGGHADKIGYIMEKCSHCVSEEMFRKNLSFKEKILILFETARGMLYLHDNAIMNRDLKWDNVLIRAGIRTEVVLTDFDTAKEDESIWKNSVQNTASSVGTPVFVAPEVLSKRYGLSVDVYSYGIMIHSILFGLLNPYSETEICPCGQKVANITPYSFPYHIKNCDLRPVIDEKKKRSMKEHEWLIELMKLCYSTNPLQRPSFKEIVSQFEKRMNNMIEKRVRIIVKGLEDEPTETYIMLDISYTAVTNKIKYRWRGHEIVQLYFLKNKSSSKKTISQQQREEEEEEVEEEEEMEGEQQQEKKEEEDDDDEEEDYELILLKDDEEFNRLMGLSNVTTIVVEFETIPETEKGKLKKELQELSEKFEMIKIETAKKHRTKITRLTNEVKYQKGDILHLRKENEKFKKKITELRAKLFMKSSSSSSSGGSSSNTSSSSRASPVRISPLSSGQKLPFLDAMISKTRRFGGSNRGRGKERKTRKKPRRKPVRNNRSSSVSSINNNNNNMSFLKDDRMMRSSPIAAPQGPPPPQLNEDLTVSSPLVETTRNFGGSEK